MKEIGKKMRMKALEGLKSAMDSDMKDGFQKVSVIAKDKKGLSEGLDKAEELLQQLPEDKSEKKDEDCEIMEDESQENVEPKEEKSEDDEDAELFEMFKKFMKMHKEMK
jgi:hypothetical protein